jgi:hypothetical protein
VAHPGRLVAAVVALVLVVGALAVVLLGRHWLEDWNDEIDRRWAPLRPALDVRYQKLEAFEELFREEYGDDRPWTPRIERLLDRWHRLVGQRDVEQENEVDTANALELAARRLVAYTQASTARAPSDELTAAMFAYARSPLPIPELPRYNRAADAYEATRDSVLGAPAAHLLAYYGRSRLGLTIL